MNLDEIKRKYRELGDEIERLENKKGEVWVPQNDENFYMLEGDLHLAEVYKLFSQKYRNKVIKAGNYYKTKDDAHRAADRAYATERIRRIILEERGDWKPDWMDGYQEKRHLVYNHRRLLALRYTFTDQYFTNDFYFPFEVYERILKRVTVEDVRLMCGVDDEG